MQQLFIHTDGMCSDVEPLSLAADYCSGNLFRSLSRAFTATVGDLSIDDYRFTPVVTFLYIVYTMLIVIILLNILIAIVNTSYERSAVEKHRLFAMSRIPILQEHEFI